MPTTQSINVVLNLLAAGGEFEPLALIARLKDLGVEESAAKEAISFLINDNQVEMTENLRLRALALVA